MRVDEFLTSLKTGLPAEYQVIRPVVPGWSARCVRDGHR
jgi:hypothetical protein